MRNLLIALFVLGSFSTFAGTILNKKTGESFELVLDNEQSIVQLNSRTAGLESKIIPLKKLSKKDFDHTPLMGLSDAWIQSLDGDTELAYFMPFLTPITLGANLIDVIVLPGRLVVRLITDSKHKKDYDIILKTIFMDQDASLGNKKFERLVKIL